MAGGLWRQLLCLAAVTAVYGLASCFRHPPILPPGSRPDVASHVRASHALNKDGGFSLSSMYGIQWAPSRRPTIRPPFTSISHGQRPNRNCGGMHTTRSAAPAGCRPRFSRRVHSNSLQMSLWPNTLARFWGAHALSAGIAAVFLAALPKWITFTSPRLNALAIAAAGMGWASVPLLAFGASNIALAVLLYRNREEAGFSLSAVGAAYFACASAAINSAWLVSGLLALKLLRSWLGLLAASAAMFAVKASLKDRLFTEGGGDLAAAAAARKRRGPGLPILAFVNRGAGAKLGAQVLDALQGLADRRRRKGLPALQVVDLSAEEPGAALKAFAQQHKAYRVLVCGGDGSAAWVLHCIEQAKLEYVPGVAMLPLGTGNDLARILGWGKSFRLDSLRDRLLAVDNARVAMLDRWDVRGRLPDGRSSVVMSNYMSIGVDAQAALLWARLYRAAPGLFKLRLLNKLWYIICGTPQLLLHSFSDLASRCELVCDGKKITLPARCEGFMVLNTPSYGGGSDLWDEQRRAPLSARERHVQTPLRVAAPDDGVLEVVAVADVTHLALSLGGISNGIRVCQGRNIAVRVRSEGVPLQIDGEPFNVESESAPAPFDLSLSLRGSSLMLSAPAGGFANGGTDDSGSGALAIDRATEAALITPQQRLLLLRSMAKASA